MATKIDELYARFMIDFVGELQSDVFYSYFSNMLRSGNNAMTLNEKFVERNIDLRWVEAIESTIIPLDNIIRNPNRYIKNIEEVVPIEMARTISTESVRHLATHTNLIAQVDGDDITPHHILNVIKEESFDTYENRFIFTLLFKLEYFLDKRMQVLLADKKVADNYVMTFNGSCTAGNDELSYDLKMNYQTPHVDLDDEVLEVGADVTQLTAMQRIERLRKILYSFKESALIKALRGCAMVRPPLTMTNVLTKNPNFRKCVDLWGFIETYYDLGFTVNMVERESQPSSQFLNDMFSMVALQYVIMKKNTQRTNELGSYAERKAESQPNVVKKSIQDLIETYDLDIDEFKRVFIDQIERKRKKIKAEFTKVKDIVKRAIATDKEFLAKQTAIRAQRIAREQAKIREEQRLEQERLEKERIEKERIERERLEQERLELERIERERLEQERLELERLEKEWAEQEKLAYKAIEQEIDALIEEETIEQPVVEETPTEEIPTEEITAEEIAEVGIAEGETETEETADEVPTEEETPEETAEEETAEEQIKVVKENKALSWIKDKMSGLLSLFRKRKEKEQPLAEEVTEQPKEEIVEEKPTDEVVDETPIEEQEEATDEENSIEENSIEVDETIEEPTDETPDKETDEIPVAEIEETLVEEETSINETSEETEEDAVEEEETEEETAESVSTEKEPIKEEKKFPRKKNRRRTHKRGLPKNYKIKTKRKK